MLYEVLTGQHPFPNVSSVERMYKHLSEPLPLIEALPTEVAEAVLGEIDEPALAYQAGIKKARQVALCDWPEFHTKVSAYLARRGFPSSVIASTVLKLWSDGRPGQGYKSEEDIR